MNSWKNIYISLQRQMFLYTHLLEVYIWKILLMICVQISKPQNICLSFLTIIYRNELLKTNKCFSNKSFSQNKKVNKKSIQKTWDYRSYFLLSFSGWHSIVVMHGGWFVPFFSFFSCGFFFGRKDDKRQNNRTILTIKDYKKKEYKQAKRQASNN